MLSLPFGLSLSSLGINKELEQTRWRSGWGGGFSLNPWLITLYSKMKPVGACSRLQLSGT